MMTAEEVRPPTFTALRLPDGRRAGVCTADKPRCIHDHYVRTNGLLISRGIVRCEYRAHAGAPKCNTALYLTKIHFSEGFSVHGANERFWFVIELNAEQIRALRTIPLAPLEQLVFLGAGLPGTYEDLVKNSHRELRQR